MGIEQDGRKFSSYIGMNAKKHILYVILSF